MRKIPNQVATCQTKARLTRKLGKNERELVAVADMVMETDGRTRR
jgi:hypothetical protein